MTCLVLLEDLLSVFFIEIKLILQNILKPAVHEYYDKLELCLFLESHLTKFTMEINLDVTVPEDLSSSTDYNIVKSKVHIAVSIK